MVLQQKQRLRRSGETPTKQRLRHSGATWYYILGPQLAAQAASTHIARDMQHLVESNTSPPQSAVDCISCAHNS